MEKGDAESPCRKQINDSRPNTPAAGTHGCHAVHPTKHQQWSSRTMRAEQLLQFTAQQSTKPHLLHLLLFTLAGIAQQRGLLRPRGRIAHRRRSVLLQGRQHQKGGGSILGVVDQTAKQKQAASTYAHQQLTGCIALTISTHAN